MLCSHIVSLLNKTGSCTTGGIFNEVKIPMSSAQSRQSGIVKFIGLSENIGYILYGGGISCT